MENRVTVLFWSKQTGRLKERVLCMLQALLIFKKSIHFLYFKVVALQIEWQRNQSVSLDLA